MFDLITFVAASNLIPIATLNMNQISELALKNDYCGIAGHYLLLDNVKLAKHRNKGQIVGTGYPASTNCLFREINRGVEWIFSNNAGELQGIANRLANINTLWEIVISDTIAFDNIPDIEYLTLAMRETSSPRDRFL